MVGHHRHTLTTVPCILAMVDFHLPDVRLLHCNVYKFLSLLTPLQYNVKIVGLLACSSGYNIKTHSSLLSLLAIDSVHIAMVASCSHPWNTLKNMLSMSLFQRWRKNPIVVQKRSHKPTTLHLASVFDLGKIKGKKLMR
jgi:hypothetical protein